MTNAQRNRYGVVGARRCEHAIDLSDPCRQCEVRHLRHSFYGGADSPALSGATDYGAAIQIPRADLTPERPGALGMVKP